METTNESTVSKTRNMQDDPQYFGAYLNMARHNIFTINNHVAKAMNSNISLLPEDGKIKDSFLCNKDTTKVDWKHAFERTSKFMPIVKIFNSETLPQIVGDESSAHTGLDYKSMADTLKSVFNELQEFRNDYSHFFSTLDGFERKKYVSREVAVFLQDSLTHAIAFAKKRFAGVLSEEEFVLIKRIKLIENDLEITTEGLVFLICIFLEREHAFQFIGKIKGLKGTQFKSFIATRETLTQYCVKLPHDRLVSEDVKQALALDLINELNRCPAVLYNSLSEDNKSEFRPNLDNDSIISIMQNSFDNADNLSLEDTEKYLEAITKRIRHDDRFPFFVLKFIDLMDAFKRLRFHIDIGKVELQAYDKDLLGEKFIRRLTDNMKVFQKLTGMDIEAGTTDKFFASTQPVELQTYAPKYNMKLNRIGIKLKNTISRIETKIDSRGLSKLKIKHTPPDAFLSLHELWKVVLLEYLSAGEPEKLIIDFINLNNNKLMTKDFIEEVKAKLPADWNEFVRKTKPKTGSAYKKPALGYLGIRKNALNTVLDEYGLNDKQIPSRILDYWLNIKDVDVERQFGERIKAMKRDCRSRLRVLGTKKQPKIGEMATFLAKDIVDMVIGEERKQKITSFYYDKLQECIALLADPEHKTQLIGIIAELKLHEAEGHPFLAKINLDKVNYTSELYEYYLKEKGNLVFGKDRNEKDSSWLSRTFYREKKDLKTNKLITHVLPPSDLSNLPFSMRQFLQKDRSDLFVWLQNASKMINKGDRQKPVNLPTNLFDVRLLELLKENLNQKEIRFEDSTKLNMLFKKWWEGRLDDVQSFYKAERTYTVYDETISFVPDTADKYKAYYEQAFKLVKEKKIAENRKSNQLSSQKKGRRIPEVDPKQIESVFKQAIAGNEKRIRVVQEQDRVIMLMIEQLLDKGKHVELKLKNSKELLSMSSLIRHQVAAKLSFDQNGEYLLGRDKPIIERTIIAQRKTKDYSILRKYVYDRRMPELFEYFPDNEIQLDALKHEIDAYNRVRTVILDKVFAIEKAIVTKDRMGLMALANDENGNTISGHLPHKAYVSWLDVKGLADTNTVIFLNMVRNCFSHNQFPQLTTMQRCVGFNAREGFAYKIQEKYNEKIDKLLNILEQE